MNDDHVQRLRYFKGQLLTAKDFEDQQTYHREKLKRFIDRFPRGIINGLDVTYFTPEAGNPEDSEAFLIGEGLAIDADGNMINVPENGIRVKVTEFNEDKPYLGLAYEEEEICLQQGCESPAKKNRIIEKVKVVWSNLPNTPGKGQKYPIITVAKVEFKPSSTIKETHFSAGRIGTNHIILNMDSDGPLIRLDAALITEKLIDKGAVKTANIAKWEKNSDPESGIDTEHLKDAVVTPEKLALIKVLMKCTICSKAPIPFPLNVQFPDGIEPTAIIQVIPTDSNDAIIWTSQVKLLPNQNLDYTLFIHSVEGREVGFQVRKINFGAVINP